MLTNLNQTQSNAFIQNPKQAVGVPKLALKEGQVLQGKVMQLFPQNMAKISLQGQTMMAKLEVGLTLGHSYWFEVLKGRKLPTIKPLLLQQAQGSTTSTLGIVKYLSQAPTKWTLPFLEQLLSRSIPFTKAEFEQAISLLQSMNPNEKGASTHVASLLEKKWPLTKESYLALLQINKGANSFIENVTKLQKQLSSLGTAYQNAQVSLEKTLSQFLHQKPSSLLQQLFISTVTSSLQNADLETAKAFIAKQTSDPSIEKAISILQHAFTKESARFQERQGGLRAEQDWVSALKEQNPKLLQAIQTLHSKLGEQTMALPNFSKLTNAERMVMSQMVESQWNEITNGSSPADKLSMKLNRLFGGLGLQFEQHLAERIQQQQALTVNIESLKGNLLQLNGYQHSLSIKQTVEQILSHLTGWQLQLTANSTQEPVSSMLFTLPMMMGDQSWDLSFQWQGTKKEDDQIQLENCRILFFLQLQNLKDTMIDVQIKEKNLHVVMYNENEKPEPLLKLLTPLLKDKLTRAGFELQTVIWKRSQPISEENKENPRSLGWNSSYQGVDILI
ncbi:hypothetical protein [Alkalihalobacillus trypoxylicola]|uniref:Flagellar hook-length control protein-like C-terminal domain-containing protein n=1 Tax=Alkalihalobacillus trypoxylicola TaxID=519424 RepID=A0A162F947_9BACI|nr:hypothetical protein [Alkalihalobacillus trypoxylicola]KYG35079.1 hypothetical protein AZF04_01725 [Alkalihalobacillus trypoxylicola]